MRVPAAQSQENKSPQVSSVDSQPQSLGESAFQLAANQPEAVAQRKLQDMANNTVQSAQLKAIQLIANKTPKTDQIAQFQAIDSANYFGQNTPLTAQKKENKTGLPDNLKSGVENLSGIAMDDVKVHPNSEKPAQLQAHAYAQGTDIHLGPGQETHLPHEAWHVVQQKQGRVEPTAQLKGIAINDNTALEREADVMGAKALQSSTTIQTKSESNAFAPALQLKINEQKTVLQGGFFDGFKKKANSFIAPVKGFFGGKKTPDNNSPIPATSAQSEKALVTNPGEVAGKVATPDASDILSTANELDQGPSETIAQEPMDSAPSSATDGDAAAAGEAPTKTKEEIKASPVADESEGKYEYDTQYWVTEPETLRLTSETKSQTAPNKNLSNADAEEMLKNGKTKSAGMFDSLLGKIGFGKQKSLLGHKLDPLKKKFFIPAMVDESSKISNLWKPIQIKEPENPNKKFKERYDKTEKYDGFYPITKMVAMPYDYNGFILDLKTRREQAKDESKKQEKKAVKVGPQSIENAEPIEKKPEASSASLKEAAEQNIVKEAGEISGATSAPAEASVEAPTKENELQEDVEKAEEGKLDLFKKYGKRIFSFATKFSFVRVWINDNLQAGGSAFNELALKAKESAKSVPLLGSLTLVTKPEGTRVTPGGITFNFGVKFPIGDKEVELSTQLFTDTQSDYSTSYIGSSAKGIAFSLGGDGDGPKFETNLGTVTHHFGSESSSYINSSGGSASLSWGTGSGNVKWNSLSFSASQTPKIKGNLSSVALGFDIFGSKANFEISNPKLKDNRLEFTEAKATLDKFEPFSGFEVGPQEVKLIPREKKYDIIGETDLKFSNKAIVQEASGKVNLSRIEEKFNLNLNNGTLKVAFLGQTIDIAGVNYDSKTDPTKVSADSAVLNLDFNNPIGAADVKATGTITKPEVSSTGFGFEKANVISNAPINLFHALTFNGINATVNQDESYNGVGNFAVTPTDLIKTAQGNVEASRDAASGSKTKYTLTDGTLGVKFLGQTIDIAGVNYDSKTDPTKVSADSAILNLDFNNPIGAADVKATGTITKPEVSSTGFGFEKANVISNAPINLFHALTFNGINATVNQDESYNGVGNFAVTPTDLIKTAQGNVEASRDAASGSKTKYTLTDGTLGVKFLGQTIDIAGVNYDSKTDPTKVSADSAILNLDFNNPIGDGGVTATGTITEPSVSKDGFDFTSANAINKNPINLFNTFTFNKINANVQKDESYSGEGEFKVKPGNIIKEAVGKVAVSKVKDAPTKYTLTDGAIKVGLLGQLASFTGVNYTSDKPEEVSMNNGTLSLEVLGKTITLDVKGASVLKSGVFDYKTIGGTLSDLSFGGAAEFKDIGLAYNKEAQTLTGTTKFELKSGFEGFTATSAGNVTVSKKDGEDASLTLDGASLNLKLGSQEIDLKKMKYAEGVLTVPEANLNFNVFGKALQTTITNGTISSAGFNYSKASLKLDQSLDFGIGKAFIGTVTATKTPTETTISGDGALSVGGGTVLGISIPELSGEGVISHTFPKGDGAGTTENNLKQVGGKLPDIKLPEAFLKGLWPFSMDLPIPVAPGVSVNIFAGLKGFLSLEGTEITVTKKAEGIYIFNAKLDKAEAELSAAIGAGVMVGNPLVASMDLGIEAAGGVKAKFDASFTKEINTNETESFTLGESESDYGVKGEIKLHASLVLEGRALYFLKKRKEKLLGEKILGSFEGKKGEAFKFKKAEAPLITKQDHAKEAKEMLPPSFAKMTEEQLIMEPQNKKLTRDDAEKAVEGLAKAAGGDSNKKMTLLGDFLYARVDFDKLESALTQFAKLAKIEEKSELTAPETTAPKPTAPEDDDHENVDHEKTKSYFTKLREYKIVKGVQAQMTENEIGKAIRDNIHLKTTLVTNYKTAITDANPDNKEDHLNLQSTYLKLNEFKKNFTSHKINASLKQFVSTKLARASSLFGGTTLKEAAAGLVSEIPKIKKIRNRLDSIQATVDAPSTSARP
jgi:hypothetical protein